MLRERLTHIHAPVMDSVEYLMKQIGAAGLGCLCRNRSVEVQHSANLRGGVDIGEAGC